MTSFKPYYKWITFNIEQEQASLKALEEVLNLIINGLPSIYIILYDGMYQAEVGFKPYYKWITFNIKEI